MHNYAYISLYMCINIYANILIKWQPYGIFIYMSMQKISHFKTCCMCFDQEVQLLSTKMFNLCDTLTYRQSMFAGCLLLLFLYCRFPVTMLYYVS